MATTSLSERDRSGLLGTRPLPALHKSLYSHSNEDNNAGGGPWEGDGAWGTSDGVQRGYGSVVGKWCKMINGELTKFEIMKGGRSD